MSLDVRERIAEAALSAFCQHGYAGSTTREIAARAEVNEVTLFRHFGTKEELFREVLRRHSPLRIVSAEAGIRLEGRDLRADLLALAEAYLAVALPLSGVIHLMIREAGRTPELAALTREIPSALRSHLAEHLRRMERNGLRLPTAPDLIAHVFYATLFHSVLRHGADCLDPDPHAVAEAISEIIAAGTAPLGAAAHLGGQD